MSVESYYQPPSDEMFNEIKAAAIQIWQTYDDTSGYATGKIGRIKDIKNVQDNAMYMVAMFDHSNQQLLFSMLELETVEMIKEKMS